MAFKIGDEVVRVGKTISSSYAPKLNTEVVRISEISTYAENCYVLEGYEVDPSDGKKQHFRGCGLRKVEKQRFTNKLTAKLAKEGREKQHDLIWLPTKKEVLN